MSDCHQTMGVREVKDRVETNLLFMESYTEATAYHHVHVLQRLAWFEWSKMLMKGRFSKIRVILEINLILKMF